MQHDQHTALIASLELKAQERPAAGQHPWPQLQSCWTLIKAIGPSFKETRYPGPKQRESAWSRFQNAVDTVKTWQTSCENRSTACLEELMKRLEEARPGFVAFDQASALTPARAREAAAQEVTTAPLSASERLQVCSKSCEDTLALFMERKWQLTPLHYKAVSDKLRGVRQEIQQAWNELRSDVREQKALRQARADALPEEERREQFRRKAALLAELETETARLEHRQSSLAGFERSLPEVTDEARRAQILRGCEECRQDITVLKASLSDIKKQLQIIDV